MSEESIGPKVQLDYRNPRSNRTGKGVHPEAMVRIAQLCAIVPAAVGLLSLGGYWLTENSSLPLLGFFLLGIGGISVMAGLIMACWALWTAHSSGGLDRAMMRRGAIVLVSLMGAITLAPICVLGGSYLMNHPVCTFVLKNTSSSRIDAGTLYVAENAEAFGSLERGTSTTIRTRLNGSGKIAVDVKHAGRSATMIVREYVDGDSAPRTPLRIDIDDTDAKEK